MLVNCKICFFGGLADGRNIWKGDGVCTASMR